MWVRQQNGHVSYDYESPNPDGSYPGMDAKPPATEFLRALLGTEFLSSVRCVILDNKFVTDLSVLTRFRDLKVLAIYIDILPEADLSVIAELENLETLKIDYTNISERHSAQIAVLREALPNCTIEFGPSVVFR